MITTTLTWTILNTCISYFLLSLDHQSNGYTKSIMFTGEIIIVDCEKNYEFPSNNAAVTCNNGTWTQIPRCQPAR